MQNLFDGVDPISVYTRAQAIADGVLIDGTIGDLAEVTRQHYKVPVAMTAEVFGLMRRAVDNPKWSNDYKGVWHDILWMSKRGIVQRFDATCHLFRVKITGTGPKVWHTLKAQCHPGDDLAPVVTIMLPNED